MRINLPDIYNEAGREAQYQEEFEYLQQARSIYERTLDSEFQSLKKEHKCASSIITKTGMAGLSKYFSIFVFSR